jgi:hypothetical protein
MPTKRGPCLGLESMWISDDKNIKRQMGTKASAWVSNKAVELNGKQKEGKVREPEGHRQGWRLRQNKWGRCNQPIRGQEAESSKLQGPFPDSVPSRYNSCFSIYTRERWTVCEKLLF